MKKIVKRLIALLCAMVLIATMIPADMIPAEAADVQEESYPYKKVITSCDSLSADSNIGIMKTSTVTEWKNVNDVPEGYAPEGKGLWKSEITTNNAKNESFYEFTLDETVDVRGYKYFNCKLYISDATLLGQGKQNAIAIALSSKDANNQAVQFFIPGERLQTGWNELKLSFAKDATTIRCNHGTYGTYNGEKINYVRVWQVKEGVQKNGETLTTYLDDVCVLNENAGVLIADCDQMNALGSTIQNGDNQYAWVQPRKNHLYVSDTETKQENTNSIDTTTYKEGIGSIKALCFNNNNAGSYRMMTEIYLSDANKQDISAYKETGSLHLWLYLSDINAINDNGSFMVELTSSGAADTYEANWTVRKSELQTGWNEIILSLNAYKVNNASGTDGQELAPDWTAINYFRIFTTNSNADAWKAGAYMLVDDIRVVDGIQVHDCDSTNGINTGTEGVLVQDEDVKQGTGAFVYNTNGGYAGNHHKLRFTSDINFSKFKNHNGSLRFWYYIQNPNLLTDEEIIVEISSGSNNSGVSAANQRYTVAKKDLVAGWNEIYINLDDPASTLTGTVDWTRIRHICIMTRQVLSDCVTKLDDISLVLGNSEKVDVRFVSTVESLGYRLVGYEIKQSRSTTPLTTETTDVYERLYAMGQDGVEDSILPEDVSGMDDSTFLHAATVVNIPNRLWDATFTVTPYWKTQDGTTVKGASKTYTMNYVLNASERLQNLNNVIDIYLIAGQSNASGSTHINCDLHGHSDDTWNKVNYMSEITTANAKYINGFENILYSGTKENNTVTMTTETGENLAKADVHGVGYMGPEVGIAESLSTYYSKETGRKAGFIKYAYGGTSLLDKEGNASERGNWVSPSYEEYLLKTVGSVMHGEKTGLLYENLMTQVATSLAEYRQAGYEPVIRGMYWMQGEDDRTLETQYRVAFKYFTQDVRKDLAELTGDTALLNMPIIIGEISETFQNAVGQVPLNKAFIKFQNTLVEEIDNCFIADSSKYQMNVVDKDGKSQFAEGVVDGFHWGWKDILSVGNDVGDIIKEHILGVTE